MPNDLTTCMQLLNGTGTDTDTDTDTATATIRSWSLDSQNTIRSRKKCRKMTDLSLGNAGQIVSIISSQTSFNLAYSLSSLVSDPTNPIYNFLGEEIEVFPFPKYHYHRGVLLLVTSDVMVLQLTHAAYKGNYVIFPLAGERYVRESSQHGKLPRFVIAHPHYPTHPDKPSQQSPST